MVTVSSSTGSFWVTNPDRPESQLPLERYAASEAAATVLRPP